MSFRGLLLAGMTALMVAMPLSARAAWPEKAVRIIVPYAPGGNTDTIARLAADRLSKALGQQFIVENKAGAAGVLAAEAVARAKPDGYTLFLATVSQVSTAPYTHDITYDPVKDFAPISIIGTNPFVVTVSADVPAKTLPEFVEYAKANPGKLNFGSGGTGGLTHLSGALFLDRAGLEIQHIPYKGGAPALVDLLAGVVQMYSGSPSELLPYADSGKVKFLGISSAERSKRFPGVPAIAEYYPGHLVLTWNGLVAPGGTPREVIDTASREIRLAMKDPAFLEQLDKIGVDPVDHSPEDFAKVIKDDLAMWGQLMQKLNIKAK